jgi:hypothetical protein
MTKEEVIAFLESGAPIAPKPDHANAENYLLALINDPEITTAYYERGQRNGWKY